jgi:Tol biopolymer transport system component
MRLKFSYLLLLAVLLSAPKMADSQFYQGSYQEFGKSRVQYNGFSWKFHAYKRFRIYYSGLNEDIAVYTARTMHHYLSDAEEKLDYKFPEKLEVIVYESQQKFRQSNLGVSNDELSNIGGTTRIVGSKIFMYFEGDHQKFNENIKSAVYEVLLKHMFFGGDWKDQLKSTVNSGIPSWLEKGLINYFVKEWDQDIESRVKDLILTRKIDNFNDLSNEEKAYAGTAVWNYIAETHGKTIIPNIIYITRVTKNVERGFFSLLGMDFNKLTRNYIAFYRSRYILEYESQEEPKGNPVPLKNKKEAVYYGAKISPDGEKIAYVENRLGRYKVIILDTLSGDKTTVYSKESKLERLQDYSFPVLNWHPNGAAIAFFSEVKGELKLFTYRLSDKSFTEKRMKDMDKVLDFGYSHDGKKMVISAVLKGQSDLYLYDVISKNISKLTDDVFDDVNPQFVENSTKVVFASNRLSDTIYKVPEINFYDRKNDIFIYDLKERKRNYKYLERVTHTPYDNEIQPYELSEGKMVYLSDQNGIYNRFIAEKDSSIAFIDTSIHYKYTTSTAPQTNYVTSIRSHSLNNSKTAIYTIYQNNKFKFITEKINTDKVDILWNTTYIQKRLDRRKKIEARNNNGEAENDTIYLEEHKYQKEIVLIGDVQNSDNSTDSLGSDSTIVKEKWKPSKFTIYQPNFAKDFVLSQFDNNFLFPNYQPYSGPGSVYFNPGMNMLLKMGASDLFDDYKLLGGVRIPTSFNSGGEFLLMAEHLTNRVDHRLIFYRQKTVNTIGLYKWLTHDIRYRFSFPFSEVLSLRTTVNVRKDKQVFIPYSDNSLILDNNVGYNSGLKTELVFDNTIPMELNIRRGLRFKIFGEYLQNLGGNYEPTFNFGIDFRHYTRIKRNFIWVNRFAAATSLGERKLLYYMGGVDNWVLRSSPDFDQSIEVDPSQNFGFQTIATPMRGFIQNIRNGNSFALYNTELRLPVFSFFSTYPIKSEMIKHFQIVAFGDVGVAWTGPHPFHPDNFFNTQVIEDKPVTINIDNLREPIIGGFGFGARTKVWGYFIRFDVAWGIEDFELNKAIPYLSLSKDI